MLLYHGSRNAESSCRRSTWTNHGMGGNPKSQGLNRVRNQQLRKSIEEMIEWQNWLDVYKLQVMKELSVSDRTRMGEAYGQCWMKPDDGQRRETQQQKEVQGEISAWWRPSQEQNPCGYLDSWTRIAGKNGNMRAKQYIYHGARWFINMEAEDPKDDSRRLW